MISDVTARMRPNFVSMMFPLGCSLDCLTVTLAGSQGYVTVGVDYLLDSPRKSARALRTCGRFCAAELEWVVMALV
jgi:hypothetical protein